MKKNILIVIEHLNGGGAERVAAELSLSFEKKGYNVTLVTFEDRGTSYNHCNDYISINLPGSSSITKKVLNLICRIRLLKTIKKDKKIDATISFIENANLVNVLSKHEDRTICSIRTVLSSVTRRSFERKIHSYILRRADCVVTLSEFVRQDLIKNFCIQSEHIQTIYNSCNLRVSPKQITKNEDEFIIISAGRLVAAKGQWHLIRAFSRIHGEYPKTRLKIMGKGPLEVQLKKLTTELNIENAVDFLGFVDLPDGEYLNADVFAFTSLWEGFGNAIVEAMACGLPVICADCPGGPREILCDKEIVKMNEEGFCRVSYGLLYNSFPNDDVEISSSTALGKSEIALYQCMKLLYKDKELRDELKCASLKRAAFFNSDKILEQWEKTL